MALDLAPREPDLSSWITSLMVMLTADDLLNAAAIWEVSPRDADDVSVSVAALAKELVTPRETGEFLSSATAL